MRRIYVIGGGLSGLLVAYRRLAAGDEVVLFEAQERLGGQLATERIDGFVIEHGAEGFVARSEATAKLAGELGIGHDLIGQIETRSYGLDAAGFRPIGPAEAAAMLGFHIPPSELGRGVRTFRRGMAQIIEALAGAVAGRLDLRRGARVSAITRSAGRLRIDADEVDAVVVTTSPAATAELLAPLFGEPARALASATCHHSVTVALAYPRDAIDHPLDAGGFVIAAAQQLDGLRAGTFATSKFPDRAPAGTALIRVFFRPTSADLALGDDAFRARAEAGLARVLPISGPATRAWISRWPATMLVHEPRHIERVRALEAAIAGSGVHLAGAAFHGAGIDAAVRSADACADALAAAPCPS